jgi:hypothetical protein
VDVALYGNFHTDSAPPYVTEHAKSLVQLLENSPPSMNNLSFDSHAINSTLGSNTLEPFSAVGGNGTVGQPGTEFVPRLENGSNVIQAGNSSGVFRFPQGNYFNGKAFGPRENSVPVLGLQKTQIMNYSDGDCRAAQVHSDGATDTQVILDHVRSNGGVKNMDTFPCDGGPLTKFSYDQTLGNLNRPEGGRAMSGSWSQEDNPSQAPGGSDGGPLTKLPYDQTLGNLNRSEGGKAMSESWSQEDNPSQAPGGSDGGALTKLPYDQTPEKVNSPEGGRAIRGLGQKGMIPVMDLAWV